MTRTPCSYCQRSRFNPWAGGIIKVKKKKKKTLPRVGKDVEQLGISYSAAGNINLLWK